jgi:hypothetical protein
MGITFASAAYFEIPSNGTLDTIAATCFWFRRSGRTSSATEPHSKHSAFASVGGFGFYFQPAAGANQDTVNLYAKNIGGSNAFDISASPKVAFDGNWHLASANFRFGSGNANDLYVDGRNKVSGNAAVAWNHNGQVTRYGTSNDSFWITWGGDIGQSATWNTVLTDAEHFALAMGASPLSIRSEALLTYNPAEHPLFIRDPRFVGSHTTSGTIAYAQNFPPICPRDTGSLFDTEFNCTGVGPTATTRHHYFPIRSGRR